MQELACGGARPRAASVSSITTCCAQIHLPGPMVARIVAIASGGISAVIVPIVSLIANSSIRGRSAARIIGGSAAGRGP